MGSFEVNRILCQGGGPGFPSWFGLRSALFGLYASSLSLLGAVRDVCQLLSDVAAAQWCCRFLLQSCGSIFGSILARFWRRFGLGGLPGNLLGSLCAPPLPRDPPKFDFWLILGRPGDAFWNPFWTSFRPKARCGAPRRPFLSSLGHMWSPFGFNVDSGCQK